MKDRTYDVVVVGGGQSGLASAYYLRRSNLDFIILDEQEVCGGAWNNAWDSLTLFSAAQHSSLPGWPMPKSENFFPLRNEVIDYFCQYEKRYRFPLLRGVRVYSVKKHYHQFWLETNQGKLTARAVIAATGTWGKPLVPEVEGLESFTGTQVHSSTYRNPEPYRGRKVLVVGEGNSGAQIMAELSKITKAKWATRKEPEFLPDDITGFDLFNVATARYKAEKEGKAFDARNYNLGNIVMVPSVLDARKRGVLQSSGRFEKMYSDGVIWSSGTKEAFDTIIWCTGFGFATDFLKDVVPTDEFGKVSTSESRAVATEGLWLVGYGSWTGFASATIIGVNRNARQAVNQVVDYLNKE